MKSKGNMLTTYKGLPREIYILFVARIINCLGNFVYPLLALILTQKIGLTPKNAGFIVTLMAVSQVPSLMIGGKVADSIGRKKVIIIFRFNDLYDKDILILRNFLMLFHEK